MYHLYIFLNLFLFYQISPKLKLRSKLLKCKLLNPPKEEYSFDSYGRQFNIIILWDTLRNVLMTSILLSTFLNNSGENDILSDLFLLILAQLLVIYSKVAQILGRAFFEKLHE